MSCPAALPSPRPAGRETGAELEDEPRGPSGRQEAGTDDARRWCGALGRARRDPDRELLKSQLFHLVSWPNLTRLPPETSAPAARICALLWRKRTAGFLIPKVLDLPPEDCLLLLHALKSLGHVATLLPPPGPVPGTIGPRAATGAAGPPDAQEAPRPLGGDSLLGKFWRRLTLPH